MLNKKRIFAIVLFVLIGLFVYTFANPAEDLEPLDNKNNTEDVDKNKDDDKKEAVIQLPDEEDNNPVPLIVNAANYDVLRTAVETGNLVLDIEAEDEGLNNLLDQLETATNNGQQLITNQINDQNLVNNGANTINDLLTRISALLAGNLEEAIEEGNRILNYYAEISNLNSNLQDLLDDLDDAIEGANDLENPNLQQLLQETTEILEIIIEIEEFQADLDIINLMSLRLVPNINDWTNQDVTLTAEYDIENPDLIEGITIVRGSTCGPEEPLPQFSRVFENLVMTAVNTKEITVSENDDYTACVTFLNGELRSATYTVENIDKDKPTLKLDTENSATYRPEHRRVAQVSDSGGSSLEKSVYAWVRLENINTFDITDLSTENGFKPVINNQNLYTPTGATGSYKLIMVAADVAGNVTEYISKSTFNLDNTGPSIDFDVNDVNISEPAQSHSVKVKVEDSETAIRYVKYQWTKTNEEPSFDSFADEPTVTLTEGVFSDPIVTLPDENGNWYLWILAVNNSVMYSDSDLATYNYQCKITSVDGKCTIYSIDGMGEFALDNVDPVFESPISKSHTTGNITINVIENNLKEIKVYNQDTNRTTVVPNGTVLTEEATYHIFVTDLAGNKVDIWTAIDRTYPTISGVENGEYYNQDVTATVFDKFLMTASVTKDNNTVTYDREDFDKNNKNENFNIELNLGDEGTYTIVGTDKVGNSKTVTFTIDKTGPTITPDNPNASTFVRPQHCRVITLADNISGVNNETLKYTWTTNRDIAVTDESFNEFTSGSRLCTTEGTGTYYLVVVAEDSIGNQSIYRTGGFPLDNTDPEVTFDTESNNTPAQSHSTIVRATDIGSGAFSTLKYQWTETNVEPTLASFNNAQTFTNNTAVYTEQGINGNRYLWVLVVDNSKNYDTNEYPNYIIEGTGPFVLDNDAPEVVSINQVYQSRQNGRVKVTILFSESITGLDFSDSQWRSTGNTNEYFNYYYRTKDVVLNFVDVAGNPGTYTFTADRTLPTATFNYSNNNGNAVTPNDVTVTLTASEDIQDIIGWDRVDSKTFTKLYGENGRYSVEIKDLVGNPNTVNFEVERIDKVYPVINGVENNGLYNTDVNYSIIEKNVKNIIIDGVISNEYAPRIGTISLEGIHTITVTDKANHSTTVTFTIDKALPTVSSLTQQYEDGKIKVMVQYSEPVRGFSVGDLDDTYWRDLGGNLYYRYYTGTQSATLNFEDLAGNPNSYTFDVDNTAPVLTVLYTEITKENGEDYNLLTGVSSDDPIATIVATVNGNEVTNFNQLPVGTHTVNYTATDSVGNYSTASATIIVKVDFTIELLPNGIIVPRRIAFTYWLGEYTVNSASLMTPEGEVNLGTVETMWDLIYGRQRVVLTKEQYNQLNSGTYTIKINYRNNWLNLDNLVMYYNFQ